MRNEGVCLMDGVNRKIAERVAAWPRIRDLPAHERDAFAAYLANQTRPVIDGVPDDQQDGYYAHDYERWRHSA